MNTHREYISVPTFDYTSAFSYRNVFNNEFESHPSSWQLENSYSSPLNNSSQNKSRIDLFLYNILVTLTYLFVFFTFPITSWVCVKKINSLQRCLTYRLGKRLPLKGPGYIIKLPFIDQISIVDIHEQNFPILDQDQQILTSDGSIIQTRQCYATLQILDAILTKTSLNKNVDVKDCLRLKLNNLIQSKHVEDLERKIEYIVQSYEDDTNRFLRKWGYAIKFQQTPKFVVLERADPMISIKKQIEKVLNFDSVASSSLENPIETLLKTSISSFVPQQEPIILETVLTQEEFKLGTVILEEIIQTYKQYLIFRSELYIQLLISDNILHYYLFEKDNASVRYLDFEPEKIDLVIQFLTCENYRSFLRTRDMSLVKYKIL